MTLGISLLVVVVVVTTVFVIGFNRLRAQNVSVDEAVGGIDVQLTRRTDLIPNLVNTVKGYAAHERAVFDEVTTARAHAAQAATNGTIAQKAEAQARLERAIVNVLAVAEAYPELKASANFIELQQQLAETENQLAFARQYYNDAAARLNRSVATIPWMFIAGAAGVSRRDFYDAPEGQEAPPAVQF